MLIAAFEDQILFLAVLASLGSRCARSSIFFFLCV